MRTILLCESEEHYLAIDNWPQEHEEDPERRWFWEVSEALQVARDDKGQFMGSGVRYTEDRGYTRDRETAIKLMKQAHSCVCDRPLRVEYSDWSG